MFQKTLLLILFFFCQTNLFGQFTFDQAIDVFNAKLQEEGYIIENHVNSLLTHQHVSSISQVHHFYLQQHFHQIPIHEAMASVHFNKNGDLVQLHHSYQKDLRTEDAIVKPSVGALEAIYKAASFVKHTYKSEPLQIEFGTGNTRIQEYRDVDNPRRIISVSLVYFVDDNRFLRLSWSVDLYSAEDHQTRTLIIDSETLEVHGTVNTSSSCDFGDHTNHKKTNECTHLTHSKPQTISIQNEITRTSSSAQFGEYRVYALPLQSPADGNRTLEVDPIDPIASPLGWHVDNGLPGIGNLLTRGNNVSAYDGGDHFGHSPYGGPSHIFDFPIDTVYTNGNQSEDAVITNLFYWVNILHDLTSHHGFTEAAGNFQSHNYSGQGLEHDNIQAYSQVLSGSCGAFFYFEVDGDSPDMDIQICNSRDISLDNIVVAHEFGHGISSRLVGGAGTVACLNNQEQMGEGFSDWFGLMIQIQNGDSANDSIGFATWLNEESINGPGIRTYRYSRDLNVNPHTYGDIASNASVHFIGSVWTAILWDITWDLIDTYGFDPDLFYGGGGNNMAMKIMIEALKLQPCSPGFVDARDAIILADEMIYGGANNCLLWNAFARRGLGLSANQGSSNNYADGTEAFNSPCCASFEKVVDETEHVIPGDTLIYTLTFDNSTACNLSYSQLVIYDTIPENTFYVPGSASHSGVVNNNVITFPTINNLSSGGVVSRTFSVYVDPNIILLPDYFDDAESIGNWLPTSTGANNWQMSMINPYEGLSSWLAIASVIEEDQFLEFGSTIIPTSSTELSFWHSFNLESGIDGGRLEYSLDNGATWRDLGPYFIKNNYNSTINLAGTTPGFSGNSNGYIQSRVDLASFTSQNLNFRFRLSTNNTISGNGWSIDNIAIDYNRIQNVAYATASNNSKFKANLTESSNIVNLQCLNGIQDGDEMGIDCGGVLCDLCPTCTDTIQNGDETGVDCGGLICDPCPTCEDGILNQDEIEIDCGGTICDACPCLSNNLSLLIAFDKFPLQISWSLVDSSGSLIDSAGPYLGFPSNSSIMINLCIPDDCYDFTIYDVAGNGLCCDFGNGSYMLVNNNTGSTITSGGSFGFSETTNFCVTSPPTMPCDSLLLLNGIITTDTYQANLIQSNGIIQSPHIVTFKAGQSIELGPEFEVQLGAELKAEIEQCLTTLSLSSSRNKNQAKKERK